MSTSQIRPVFIYGRLRSLRALAWVLTGDDSSTAIVSRLIQPAKIYGFAQFCVEYCCDYPEIVEHEPHSSVDGYLLVPETASQRKKIEDFEGKSLKGRPVIVTVLDADGNPKKAVHADMYLWHGKPIDKITPYPWNLEAFEAFTLERWLAWEKTMARHQQTDYNS
ncbi:AIG2-like protein [Hypomontagnella submonticulosa]|nr:AIG2-like protein [Hypomontagnella submonticulosa]